MHDRAGLLPEWAVAELRRPVSTSDALRDRVMARVRAAARPHDSAPALNLRRADVTQRGPGVRVSGALLALAASVVDLSSVVTR